jgi:O-acetyl-ADP-ribose deacetylase (regulator of RNase III)
MITFTQGNLLEAPVDALVNTVNTVGVMGKGIALMFRDRFQPNFKLYAAACKAGQVQTGRVFVTETGELSGPRWIVNFPTKQNWRSPSRLEWVVDGLQDLKRFLLENQVQSVAIPPLGAGNGGLDWPQVRREIELALADLPNIDVLVFEPTTKYQNVAKRSGVEKLTPPRALIAELVRRYWVLGMECSLLEIQKLAWFMARSIERLTPSINPLKLEFKPHIYGPYTTKLNFVLNDLDGSYLHCDKRISDADKLDVIWFDDGHKDVLRAYLKSEAKVHLPALEATAQLIDGFESPFGMELLSTVDWLLSREGVQPNVESVRHGLQRWPAPGAAERKSRLFDDRVVAIALARLQGSSGVLPSAAH